MAGDAERRYIIGSGWQTVAVSASGIVTAADVDSDGAANGEVLTADGGGGASWEAGGGGSLPAWWTVDSTPGSESVEFAGDVLVTDGQDLRIDDSAGNTARLAGGVGVIVAEDTGAAIHLVVNPSGATHAMLELDQPDGDLKFARLEVAGSPVFEVGPTGAVTISPSETTDIPITTTANEDGAVFAVTGAPTLDPATCTSEDIANALIALGLATP